MKNKTNFDKLFGNQPKWLQRLLRERGKDAFSQSKHARGKGRPRNFWEARKKRNKAAKLMRRKQRGHK